MADDIVVRPSTNKIGRYSTVIIDISLSSDFKDPYDPKDIAVDAVITDPEGNQVILPCFYKDGDPDNSNWEARFTPRKTGDYSYHIAANQNNSEMLKLSVKDSSKDGFINANPNSYFTFLFDSGKKYRGVGPNFGWESKPSENFKYTYETFSETLSQNNCNFIRTWMCPWNLPLEWKKHGIGKYDPEVAARLDEIFALAEENDFYIMLVLGYHGEFNAEKDYWGANDEWNNSPYNVANGGPCEVQEDFFVEEEAKEFYRRRLRYIVARWGYTPYLGAIEFWNEIENIAKNDIPADVIVAWHKEMAKYLKTIDPYGHLATTSSHDYDGLWETEEIDFSQTHPYGTTVGIKQHIISFEEKYKKPHVAGEFAYSWQGPWELKVPELFERELHIGLWRGLFSPTPILPLTWWWDIHAGQNEFFHFKAVSNFNDMILASGDEVSEYEGAADIDLRFSGAGERKMEKDKEVLPAQEWANNKDVLFSISKSGQVANAGLIPSFLFSPTSKADMRNPPEFEITFHEDGEFEIEVGKVSQNNKLQISVNGDVVLEEELRLGEGKGPWKESTWNDEYQIWQGVYDKTYKVPVKKGRHKIKVENVGDDWIFVKSYTFKNCGIFEGPKISYLTLQSGDNIYLWVRNSDLTTKKEELPEPAKAAIIDIPNLKHGSYTVTPFDTYKGVDLEKSEVNVSDTQPLLSITVEALQTDIAYRIEKK